ncbi:MAG: PQQ-binding-like beta-propeller repeat protein [Gemmataceae bacterium]|nr:PQQ-binding-like beta-propeller repeat protein [Gemmataceae bacterium]
MHPQHSYTWHFVLAAVALSGVVAARGHADWPQFRGPGGMGVSTEKAPVTWSAQQNLAWKIKMPVPGASSPIIVGDCIYLTGYSGYAPGQPGSMDNLRLHLLCLNRGDGALRWNKSFAAKTPEQDRIRENHGYASATPVADAERIYTFFGKSGVIAFSHDGEQLWQADVGDGLNGWGSAASPVLAGDLVIINASVESGALVALDKRTGKQVWTAPGIRESWNTPVLVDAGGRKELVVAIMGKVLAFDPASGTPLWSCKTDIGWYMVPGLVAEKGVIGVLGGRDGVVGLAVRAGGKGDVTGTHRLWTSTKGTNVPSPVVHQGHLYWMSDVLGIAYCADLTTGQIRYDERVPGAGAGVYASAVLADGKIYYLGRDGRMFVVAARPQFELLATNTLGERAIFNASPAIDRGRIYIRTDQSLYCIGAK